MGAVDSCVGDVLSVICQSLFNRMPCLEACRLNTQCPAFPPTLWFSCELMNLITFVSACCCVQKGLFGTLSSTWEGHYSCNIPMFGLVFKLSHDYGRTVSISWLHTTCSPMFSLNVGILFLCTVTERYRNQFRNTTDQKTMLIYKLLSVIIKSFKIIDFALKNQSEHKKGQEQCPDLDSRHKMKRRTFALLTSAHRGLRLELHCHRLDRLQSLQWGNMRTHS